MRWRAFAWLVVAVMGCSKAKDPCANAHPHGAMSWIADDLPGALACAKQRNQPVVLDLWAPWCHTCLSMQSTVFTDASFKADAGKFVFAALDTDREGNAEAVAKYPPSAWPTFYVIAPDGAVLARFVGGASKEQFHAFLDAGTRAMAGGAQGPDGHLLTAERALAAKDLTKADTELRMALARAPADWPRRPDALVSLINTKAKQGDKEACMGLAETDLDHTGSAASASDFLVIAMGCAEEMAKDPAHAERVRALRERAVARWRALIDDAKAPLSVDDRSDAMASVRETLDALGKDDDAHAVAEGQRLLLDEAMAQAPTPMARMTHIWPRAEVYVYLGRPLDLVADYQKLAKELPQEYDVPARLGWLYLKADKLAEAATWTDKAIALAYGPRKARVLAQRADIAQKQGDKAAERRYREDIVKLWESLPPAQQNPEALAKAKQTLVDIDKPPPAAASK
jgi:thioredoxin-like negative regulator of GroEL